MLIIGWSAWCISNTNSSYCYLAYTHDDQCINVVHDYYDTSYHRYTTLPSPTGRVWCLDFVHEWTCVVCMVVSGLISSTTSYKLYVTLHPHYHLLVHCISSDSISCFILIAVFRCFDVPLWLLIRCAFPQVHGSVRSPSLRLQELYD